MKEFRVMVFLKTSFNPAGKWFVLSGRNCRRQPVFNEKEDAETWLRKRIEQNKDNDYYNGAVYKVMERTVTKWTDSE